MGIMVRKYKHKQNFFDFLSSYINEHPEQLVRDDDCGDCSDCEFDQISRCSTPIGSELWDYDIKDVAIVDQCINTFTLDFLIKAEIEVYRSDKDYQVGGEQVMRCYKFETYLDFDELKIMIMSISICEDW